jgi:hypothetical protein
MSFWEMQALLAILVICVAANGYYRDRIHAKRQAKTRRLLAALADEPAMDAAADKETVK